MCLTVWLAPAKEQNSPTLPSNLAILERHTSTPAHQHVAFCENRTHDGKRCPPLLTLGIELMRTTHFASLPGPSLISDRPARLIGFEGYLSATIDRSTLALHGQTLHVHHRYEPSRQEQQKEKATSARRGKGNDVRWARQLTALHGVGCMIGQTTGRGVFLLLPSHFPYTHTSPGPGRFRSTNVHHGICPNTRATSQ